MSAVAAVSLAWKRAYNDRDIDAVVALYTEDAVLSVPGMPHVQGREAIAGFFRSRIEKAGDAGLQVEDVPLGDVVVAGSLAWQWQTFEMVHRELGVVGSGALCTLFRKLDGAWFIAGDISNLAEPRVDLYAHVESLR
ncbi:YybH family protein [Nocardioides alcanivorans]|uniref:YybH family protein n=1 Tax=Nocardioides alcanivorans TaxID=2897352 RepID=UPI0035DF8169